MKGLKKEWGPMLKQATGLSMKEIKTRCLNLDRELGGDFLDNLVDYRIHHTQDAAYGANRVQSHFGGFNGVFTLDITSSIGVLSQMSIRLTPDKFYTLGQVVGQDATHGLLLRYLTFNRKKIYYPNQSASPEKVGQDILAGFKAMQEEQERP